MPRHLPVLTPGSLGIRRNREIFTEIYCNQPVNIESEESEKVITIPQGEWKPDNSDLIYLKLSGAGLQKEVYLACHPEDEPRLTKEAWDKGLEVVNLNEREVEELKAKNLNVISTDRLPQREPTHRITRMPHYLDMPFPVNSREAEFQGPCCDRCQHRFGSTSNHKWCKENYKRENCHRFKLER